MSPAYGPAGRLAAAFIQSKLTPLVILASIALGGLAVIALPREEEPQIIVPMIDLIVGMPGAKSTLDLTALWYKEVRLAGSYAYSVEKHDGKQTSSFQLALSIAPTIRLETLVGPHFRLEDYREAIAAALSAGRDGRVKVVFDHKT